MVDDAGLRIALTISAADLLGVSYVKAGRRRGFDLDWHIALLPDNGSGHETTAAANLSGATKTIIVTDHIVSLDDEIAVATSRNSTSCCYLDLQ